LSKIENPGPCPGIIKSDLFQQSHLAIDCLSGNKEELFQISSPNQSFSNSKISPLKKLFFKLIFY